MAMVTLSNPDGEFIHGVAFPPWSKDARFPISRRLLDDETLKGKPIAERRQWSKMVVEQLTGFAHPKGVEIVFIGGKRYREFVIPQLLSIPDKLYTARAPLAGLGIGYQMQWLKQNTPQYKHLQLALL